MIPGEGYTRERMRANSMRRELLLSVRTVIDNMLEQLYRQLSQGLVEAGTWKQQEDIWRLVKKK